MPKKAVAIFFIAAFIGAAIFVYFTFPRTKDEIPKSNNQRPFPSAPDPTPNGVPVSETVPHPNTPTPPKLPPGPTLRVMAWASGSEAKALETEADAFQTATGRTASLTIVDDAATYRHDLLQALASDAPPDICLVASRDFSGLDPAHDLITLAPEPTAAPRSVIAFTVNGDIKAAPDEFSVDVLFYNPAHFDQAGIGYPDRHWNWDILEAMTRALSSLKLKDADGDPIYPLELPADFDFWNILCMQAGHAALDLDTWHLADAEGKDAQIRVLDLIHQFFQGLSVTPPLPKGTAIPGTYFAQQRASLLIAPSSLTATLPKFHYAITLLPGDMVRASLARVNGWAVTAKSTQPDAAREMALYLAWQPVHAGWSSVQKPSSTGTPEALCYEALDQALIPRVNFKSASMAQFLDQQIGLLARNSNQSSEALYTRIQAKYQSDIAPAPIDGAMPAHTWIQPSVKASPQLRGL